MYKRYDGGRIVLIDEQFNIIGLNDPHQSAPWFQVEIHSVQHTGTRFLNHLLESSGWYCRATHFTPSNVKDKGLVVSPMRDPWKTLVSWMSRDRKDSFIGQWRYFDQVYRENPDLYIVPIDTPDREEHLQILSERMKCDFKTDWAPVGSLEHKPFNLTDRLREDLDEVYNLSVVRKFYETDRN